MQKLIDKVFSKQCRTGNRSGGTDFVLENIHQQYFIVQWKYFSCVVQFNK